MTELEANVFLSHQDADNLKDAYDLADAMLAFRERKGGVA